MASHRQHKLDRILDLSGPGTYNEETGRWSQARPSSGIGDRQSDALARQIAMAPILNANAALLATTFADSSQKAPSRTSTPNSNADFNSAIDESIARSRKSSEQRDEEDRQEKARLEDKKRRLQALPPSHNDISPDLATQMIKTAIQKAGRGNVYISSSQYDYLKSQSAKGDQGANKVLSITNEYLKSGQIKVNDGSRLERGRYPLG
jgi:hypothetical protein